MKTGQGYFLGPEIVPLNQRQNGSNSLIINNAHSVEMRYSPLTLIAGASPNCLSLSLSLLSVTKSNWRISQLTSRACLLTPATSSLRSMKSADYHMTH